MHIFTNYCNRTTYSAVKDKSAKRIALPSIYFYISMYIIHVHGLNAIKLVFEDCE